MRVIAKRMAKLARRFSSIPQDAMTIDTATPRPLQFADLIAAAADAVPVPKSLSEMPKAERMRHHRKELDSIAFWQGIEGVQRYKEDYPEAVEVGVNLQARAYLKKPKGYEAYLAKFADTWLTSWIAVNETNRADVQRINDHFDIRLNPDKHFSEELTAKRLERIKTTFDRYAAPLDIRKIRTMSDVRQAAKAFWVHTTADKPFGNVGAISGRTLVLKGERFNIEKNGERDCIRPTIGGKRRRLYLDELEWVANLLVSEREDPLLTTTMSSTGELPYLPGLAENVTPADPKISELPSGGPSSPLGQRIASLKAECPPHSMTYDADDDPLNHLPLHD